MRNRLKSGALRALAAALMAVCLSGAPARAAQPEFDTVGGDDGNVFNDRVAEEVVARALDGFGNEINLFSDFPEEFFLNAAGQLYPDWCFEGHLSALVDPWSEALFAWRIVLQMKPQSDIDVEIVNCVTNGTEPSVWTAASQTGRYRSPWGGTIFIPSANPNITVAAHPGPFATPGFVNPFQLEARQLPTLASLPLYEAFFTGKALWEASLIVSLPVTGQVNALGQPCYSLKAGDAIEITVKVPYNNTAYIRFGRDNVLLKYIGVMGTEYSTAVMGP
jgi:hypothetical protein